MAMSFVQSLVDLRSRAALREQKPAARKAEKRPLEKFEASRAAADAFAELHVGEKVLRDHAATFKPALADMRALEKFAEGLEPHRAKQLGRTLEAFYAKLGVQLARLPNEDRKGN